jgi:hypothetical protein
MSAQYAPRRVLVAHTADPCAAAELVASIKEQATALVEEMSKQTDEKKHPAAESTNDNASTEANKNKNGKGDSDEDSDDPTLKQEAIAEKSRRKFQ